MAKKIADIELRSLALVGARARLAALQGELASLLATFPELRGAKVVGGRRLTSQAQEAWPQASDVGRGEEGGFRTDAEVLGGSEGGEEVVVSAGCRVPGAVTECRRC